MKDEDYQFKIAEKIVLTKQVRVPIHRPFLSNEEQSIEIQESLKKDEISQNEQIFVDQSQQSKQSRPIKRSRISYSQQQEMEEQVPGKKVTRKKQKYDKKGNQGNEAVYKNRIKQVFKQICDPNGVITVNTLGKSLQKYGIAFELQDVVDLLELYWTIRGQERPVNEGDRIIQVDEGELNIGAALDFGQFEELYKKIRKKK